MPIPVEDAPDACQICNRPICPQGYVVEEYYVEGLLIDGTWSTMCLDCHKSQGVGLWKGQGQIYAFNGETYSRTKG